MGLTGMILTARLQLRRVESAWLLVDYHRALDLDDCLTTMEASDDQYDYSVAWIDGLTTGKSMGRSVLMRGNHAAAGELRIREPLEIPKSGQRNLFIDLPSGTLNRLTIKTFNNVYYATHASRRKRLLSFEEFFYPLDAILQWNRMYGKRGFVQYQIALPFAAGREGLRVILEKLSRSGRASFLAVLKRFGDAGKGLLSFPMRGYTLALDIPAAPGLEPFLHELDRMTLDHGGRVYLAKDAVLQAEDFAAMYPRLDEFRAIQRKLDPARKLSSSMARRLRIIE
jgi:FAD/FMN-containing dehydrogenase